MCDQYLWSHSEISRHSKLYILIVYCIIAFFSQMRNASDDRELEQVLQSEEFDFLYDCGIHQPLNSITVANRDTIISAIAKHFSVIVCKAELDQLIEGLSTLCWISSEGTLVYCDSCLSISSPGRYVPTT